MVQVFVSKEARPGETRVVATPETVKQLLKAGVEVAVEAGAGVAASFPDSDAQEAGATIHSERGKVWSSADVVLAVNPPSPEEAKALKSGAALVCGLQPLLNLPLVSALVEAKVSCFAMDLMPRITRAQKMDILSSQATVSGYQAVLMAAAALPKMFPLLMTAAGTLTPAKVVILGAGVAGLQAIATARRLGAVVEANDIRPAVREQVESLGGTFIDTGTPPQAETAGGYAKETSEEYARKQREILTKHLSAADVVVTTALIPGRKAPILIDKAMLESMSPGTVVVDLAVEMGGNVEGAVSGETVEIGGVRIIGEPNLPGLCPRDASLMFGRNVHSFLELMLKDGKLEPDWEDECVVGTAVTHDGDVKHAASAEALSAKGSILMTDIGLFIFIFVLASFVGFEVITKVPPTLHTPLMSGSNAISGVTIVGALLAVSAADNYPGLAAILGFVALIFATINVVGGFMVTDRMLAKFKRKN